jgi:hypothetical protein
VTGLGPLPRKQPARALAAFAAAVTLGAWCASAAPLVAARATYVEGQAIEVTGVVTDAQGVPLSDITVTLEASRTGLDLRWLRRVQRDLVRFSTVSNARGEFSLSFPWSGYYNRYELVAGVPVRKTDGEHLEVFERVDLSGRIAHGSPVVAALAVKDTRFLNSLREFVAGLGSDDERQVYHAMGKPDAIDRLVAGPQLTETWWYYEAGKSYRFDDGRLAQVETFDPVRRF